MSQGMLGLLKLSDVRGPRNDLDEKLAGPDGLKWLIELKKFLRKQFTLLVGDGRTKESLLAAGRYDSVGHIAKAFVTSPSFRWTKEPCECDIELVEFNYDPSSDQVLAEFAKRGLLEPTEEDALRFGGKYPDEQLESPIVFLHKENIWLGSFDFRGVLVLGAGGSERELGCGWFVGRWGRGGRGAARRPRK